MMLLSVVQLIGLVAVKMTETPQAGEVSGPAAIFAFHSWRFFLIAMGVGSLLFWLGDHLTRTH